MTKFQLVSPLDFYRAFLQVASEEVLDLQMVWSRYRDFTSLMRSGIFPKIAKRLGLSCYPSDYYWLDAILYAERDSKYFPVNTTYAKFISVALEHENYPKGTPVEMNKLQLFNSPLKVLITYPDSDDHGKKLLEIYAEIVAEADIFDDITNLRRQLVIFGFQGEPPRWQGFEYVHGKFAEVKERA